MILKAMVKFGIVGASGAVVNALVFNGLVFSSFFAHYYLLANTIAFMFAVTNNFYWNYKWTFKGRAAHKSVREKYTKFLVIAAISFAVNTFILSVMVSHFGMNKRIANLAAILLTSAMNFTGNWLITFKDK